MTLKEELVYAINQQGHVYLTQWESPLKPGYQRFSTTTPSEMDRIYAKLSKQEGETYAKMTEQVYARRKEFIEQNLSDLRTKIANEQNPIARDFLKAWMAAFERKQDQLMKGTVYGVAEIQRREAARPVERELITADDLKKEKVSEVIN